MNGQALKALQRIEEFAHPDGGRPGAVKVRDLDHVSLHDDPTISAPCPLANDRPCSCELAERVLADLGADWAFDPRPFVIALVDSLGIYSGAACDHETAWMVREDVQAIAADYHRQFVAGSAAVLISAGAEVPAAIALAKTAFRRRFGEMTAERMEQVRLRLVAEFDGLCARTRGEFRNAFKGNGV